MKTKTKKNTLTKIQKTLKKWRRRGCTGLTAYPYYEDAQYACRGTKGAVSYMCHRCYKWHIGVCV